MQKKIDLTNFTFIFTWQNRLQMHQYKRQTNKEQKTYISLTNKSLSQGKAESLATILAPLGKYNWRISSAISRQRYQGLLFENEL